MKDRPNLRFGLLIPQASTASTTPAAIADVIRKSLVQPHYVDAAYPADTAIKLILDNHAAHISKETKARLTAQPDGRFEFTFTPKDAGSWLNLIEGLFSSLARRHRRTIACHRARRCEAAAAQHPAIAALAHRLFLIASPGHIAHTATRVSVLRHSRGRFQTRTQGPHHGRHR